MKKRKDSAKIKLGVFDIDGTIFRSSLLIEPINGLVEAGIFPPQAKKDMEADYLAWLNREGSYSNYINQVIKIHLKYIGGREKKAVTATVNKVLAREKDRVYRYTRDLIKKLKRENYYLVAISGSPEYIVSRFAAYLGFKASFGRAYEIKNGRFTGRASALDTSLNKDEVLAEFIKKKKLRVDFKNSLAVGDTEGDVSFLKLFGRPIAFNPNRLLAEYAKKAGWTIVVERKDVIYRIEKFSFSDDK